MTETCFNAMAVREMDSFTGQLLIAMPQLDDMFFARSVVFVLSHSLENGAMGLIVNRHVQALTLGRIYADLKVEPLRTTEASRPVHFGGPVAPDHAFVLHSTDYHEEGTQAVSDGFALTATLDVIRAMARGSGPSQALIAVGYAGWAPGQLEAEIKANGWLLVGADPDIVFHGNDEAKWEKALAKLGVSPELISGSAGQA